MKRSTFDLHFKFRSVLRALFHSLDFRHVDNVFISLLKKSIWCPSLVSHVTKQIQPSYLSLILGVGFGLEQLGLLSIQTGFKTYINATKELALAQITDVDKFMPLVL